MKLKKPTTNESGTTAEAFIAQAGATKKKEAYPWVGEDRKKTKVFSLRIPMDSYQKLKYLSEVMSRTSMNDICLDALEPYLDELLKKHS